MANGVFHHQSTPAQPNAETLICRNSLSYIDNIIAQEEPYPFHLCIILLDLWPFRIMADDPGPRETLIRCDEDEMIQDTLFPVPRADDTGIEGDLTRLPHVLSPFDQGDVLPGS
jgi:hypothetical protein